MTRILVILLVLLLSIFPAAAGFGDEQPSGMSLLAINVRKADALLLRCEGTFYLIDTGSKDSFEHMYAVLQSEGVRLLDGVILTHTDKDHIGGLKQLLNSDIEVRHVYTSAYYIEKKSGKHPAEKSLKGTGKELEFLSAGDTLPMTGGSLTVLGPLEPDEEKENNNSLVILAECGSGSILLTGDMEFPEEASLLKAGKIPQADVLKIANHGEGDATSTQLVATVSPKLAVISTNSDDEPDTPDPRIIKLLEDRQIPWLVTENSVNGIEIILENYKIRTEVK